MYNLKCVDQEQLPYFDIGSNYFSVWNFIIAVFTLRIAF